MSTRYSSLQLDIHHTTGAVEHTGGQTKSLSTYQTSHTTFKKYDI